ncbi:hypothetical protein D3C80_1209930 [compost metagenome]
MKVAALDQVVGQPFGRDKPAAPLFPVNQPACLQLHQRLAQGDARGVEHFAELAFGRQLAAGREKAMLDLLLQGMTDSCYCTRRQWLHRRLPIWTSPAPAAHTIGAFRAMRIVQA